MLLPGVFVNAAGAIDVFVNAAGAIDGFGFGFLPGSRCNRRRGPARWRLREVSHPSINLGSIPFENHLTIEVEAVVVDLSP